MARFFITVVVALAAGLLWFVVAALLMRLFGARLPLLPFTKKGRRAVQLLTFSQSVCHGVLFFGGGIFIAETVYEYLFWRYWDAPSKDVSSRILGYAVFWPVMGVFIGLFHASENRNRRATELSKQRLKEVSGWDENGFSK